MKDDKDIDRNQVEMLIKANITIPLRSDVVVLVVDSSKKILGEGVLTNNSIDDEGRIAISTSEEVAKDILPRIDSETYTLMPKIKSLKLNTKRLTNIRRGYELIF